MSNPSRKPTKTGNPPHRPKIPIVTPEKLQKALLDNELNAAGAARDLGVATRTVSAHLQRKPEILRKVENAREAALRKAGITRSRVYKRINEGLDATKMVGLEAPIEVVDFKERREHAKLSLNLLGDLHENGSLENFMAMFHFMIPGKAVNNVANDMEAST